jgi:hypothetical protein
MSHAADEQIRRTLDALLERLRTSLADQVTTTAGQLSESVGAVHREALEAARRDAATAAERDIARRLNEEFARREEQVREAARAEWFEAGVKQGRAEGAASLAAREAEAQAAAKAAAQAAADAATAQSASLESARAARREETGRLLRALQAMDATGSLSQTLDAVATAVKAETARSAILLPRGAALRVWSHAGFPLLQPESTLEIPLPEAGLAADTIHTGRVHRIGAGEDGRPAFATDRAGDPGAVFVAVPMTMNSQVIAVLCAEDPVAEDGGDRLASVLEILARHGARVLESLTALRLARLGTHSSSAVAAAPH